MHQPYAFHARGWRSCPAGRAERRAGLGVRSGTAATAIFTVAQAEAGRSAYQEHCASCHAGDLGGRNDAPALKGDAFLATWQAKPAKELVEFVSATMPPEGGRHHRTTTSPSWRSPCRRTGAQPVRSR
jgi:mono/diheme cytochrome c family protein